MREESYNIVDFQRKSAWKGFK